MNLAAEWWDAFNVLISKRAIILPANEKLFLQLSDRHKEYAIVGGQLKTKLESKQDMKARGADSPDLADSVIMSAMTGYCGTQACLNPAGDKRFLKDLHECARAMRAYSSNIQF